jgi:hypothetical protein
MVSDWGTGAKNAVVQVLPETVDPDTTRYVAAWMGLLHDQRGVLIFEADDTGDGPDSCYTLDVRTQDPEDVRSQLDRLGLRWRTIAPVAKGLHILIFDPGRRLRHKVEQFVRDANARVREAVGRGDYVGGSTRTAARSVYRAIIARYESGLPTGARAVSPSAAGPGDPRKAAPQTEWVRMSRTTQPLRLAARHAPAGGALVRGIYYAGGETLPADEQPPESLASRISNPVRYAGQARQNDSAERRQRNLELANRDEKRKDKILAEEEAAEHGRESILHQELADLERVGRRYARRAPKKAARPRIKETITVTPEKHGEVSLTPERSKSVVAGLADLNAHLVQEDARLADQGQPERFSRSLADMIGSPTRYARKGVDPEKEAERLEEEGLGHLLADYSEGPEEVRENDRREIDSGYRRQELGSPYDEYPFMSAAKDMGRRVGRRPLGYSRSGARDGDDEEDGELDYMEGRPGARERLHNTRREIQDAQRRIAETTDERPFESARKDMGRPMRWQFGRKGGRRRRRQDHMTKEERHKPQHMQANVIRDMDRRADPGLPPRRYARDENEEPSLAEMLAGRPLRTKADLGPPPKRRPAQQPAAQPAAQARRLTSAQTVPQSLAGQRTAGRRRTQLSGRTKEQHLLRVEAMTSNPRALEQTLERNPNALGPQHIQLIEERLRYLYDLEHDLEQQARSGELPRSRMMKQQGLLWREIQRWEGVRARVADAINPQWRWVPIQDRHADQIMRRALQLRNEPILHGGYDPRRQEIVIPQEGLRDPFHPVAMTHSEWYRDDHLDRTPVPLPGHSWLFGMTNFWNQANGRHWSKELERHTKEWEPLREIQEGHGDLEDFMRNVRALRGRGYDFDAGYLLDIYNHAKRRLGKQALQADQRLRDFVKNPNLQYRRQGHRVPSVG